MLTGNYIDNCSVEWSNEHDALPNFASEFSFGSLTIHGNIFTVNDVSAAFRFLVVRPRGAGHFINGFSVMGNTFRTVNATIDRVDKVDTTTANLDFSRMRNIVFDGNTFNGITEITINPVTVLHQQNTASQTWVVNGSNFLPFSGWARSAPAVVADGPVTTASDAQRFDAPFVQVEQGTSKDRINLRWPVDVKGQAWVTLRCDAPS